MGRPKKTKDPDPHHCQIEEEYEGTQRALVTCKCGATAEVASTILAHELVIRHQASPLVPMVDFILAAAGPGEPRQPETPATPPPALRDYRCLDCHAEGLSPRLTSEELEEHLRAVGHTHWDRWPPEQTDLFTEGDGIVTRDLRRVMTNAEQDEIRIALSREYEALYVIEQEKAAADKEFKDRMKPHEGAMVSYAKTLADPYSESTVDCRWLIEATERVLRRVDSGEELERRALTAEDRAALEKPAPATKTAAPVEAKDPATLCDYCGHRRDQHVEKRRPENQEACNDLSFNITCDCLLFTEPYVKKNQS